MCSLDNHAWQLLLVLSTSITMIFLPGKGQISDTLSAWYTSSTVLESEIRGSAVGYNKITDTIWIIGGFGCTTCVQSYHVETDTITSHSDISGAMYSLAGATSVMVDQVLYYYPYNVGLSKYDTTTLTESYAFTSPPSLMLYPCMALSLNKTQIYITGDSDSKLFYVYDILSGVWISGPSTTNSHQYTACEVSNSNHLYIKGRPSSYVEKINLDSLDVWITLSTQMFPANGFATNYAAVNGIVSATVENLIYYIGGVYCNSGCNVLSDVLVIDTTTDRYHIQQVVYHYTDTPQMLLT